MIFIKFVPRYIDIQIFVIYVNRQLFIKTPITTK